MTIETRITNPGVLQALLDEQANPPAPVEQVEDVASEEEAVNEAAPPPSKQNEFPGLPTLIVLEPPLRRCCDAVIEAIDRPLAETLKAIASFPGKVESLVRTFAGGLVNNRTKEVRNSICKQCPDCEIAARFVGGRMKILGYFCRACTCGVHPLSELTGVKNLLRDHVCPKGRHPDDAPRSVIAWRTVRSQGINCRMPEEFGCGCGIETDKAPAGPDPR